MTDNNIEERTCSLDALLDAITTRQTDGAPAGDAVITSVTADSRQVREGSMFVAVRGVAVDGHRFLPQAVAAGARAIVVEEMPAHSGRAFR